MKPQPILIALFFLGLALLVLSFIWPSLVMRSAWTEEQAIEHATAAAEMHRLVHEQEPAGAHAHAGHAPTRPAGAAGQAELPHGPEALQAAKMRYEKSAAALKRAQAYYSGTAVWLKWIGIMLIFIGGGGYVLVVRAAD